MTTYIPPKKNVALVFGVSLQSVATVGQFQANPTLASGDVKISKDGGAFANLTNLPTVNPASGKRVEVSLTSTEMNADNVTIIFSDQTNPAEWVDLAVHIQTAVRQIDDLAYPATSGRSLAVDASGQVTVGAIANGVIAAATFAANALDAVWSTATRVLTAGTNIVLAKGTGLTGLNDIAAGAAMTLTSGERTAVANEVEAQIIDETDSEKVLTAITDKIASVNPSLSGLTLAAIASQVRTELTPELDHIDADISSRLASADYTAPDNAGIGAIKAKTDNLPASPAASGDIPTASISAIKAKTDGLTFTEGGTVDANIKFVNDTAVGGTGENGDPWGPA